MLYMLIVELISLKSYSIASL